MGHSRVVPPSRRLAPGPRLAEGQAGVVSRSQLLAAGVSPGVLRAALRSGRWRRVHPGVYATHTGPLPELARVWAAVLYCGPGAVAAGRTALWLAGVDDRLPRELEIVVPATRTVVERPGLVVRRSRTLARTRHPAADPPRIRLEAAVIDLADTASHEPDVVDLVLRAVQRRRTTAGHLRAELAARARHRRRRLLTDLLADVVDGAQSPLERRYLRDVERLHRLPRSARNRPELDPVDGSRRYRDVRYARYQLVVELDGREAHPDAERFRDRRRDNRLVVAGSAGLRYGWREVVGTACEVAVEVASVLRSRGWRGAARPCGPHCAAAVDRSVCEIGAT